MCVCVCVCVQGKQTVCTIVSASKAARKSRMKSWMTDYTTVAAAGVSKAQVAVQRSRLAVTDEFRKLLHGVDHLCV